MTVESKPSNTWGRESKITLTSTRELIPAMPGSTDGAWTDPAQDGAWTEYPLDGAYTSIGYEPEFKPPNRYTTSVESKPSNTYAREGKPS